MRPPIDFPGRLAMFRGSCGSFLLPMAAAAMQAGASKASYPELRRPPAELGAGWPERQPLTGQNSHPNRPCARASARQCGAPYGRHLMSLSLHDQQLRIADLETALVTLVQTFAGTHPANAFAVSEAARALRAQGSKGAAGLLEGAAANAAYRR